MAIAVDQNYDKAQRKISTANLEQFAGVDCQLLVEKGTHRPIIMDGVTVGGKFKCASTDELEAVKAKADSAVSADSVQWEGVEGVPDNVKNALSFISQSLTTEQKAQVVQNLAGTFLPLTGGTVTGRVYFNNSSLFGHRSDDVKMLEIIGGKEGQTGSKVRLYDSTDPTFPGYFICATNNEKSLMGIPDGRLLWESKEVERVNAIGENYIRFESGIQICWGGADIQEGIKTMDVLLPVPYVNDQFTPIAIFNDVESGEKAVTCAKSEGNTNKFKLMCSTIDNFYGWTRGVYWATIGRWK